MRDDARRAIRTAISWDRIDGIFQVPTGPRSRREVEIAGNRQPPPRRQVGMPWSDRFSNECLPRIGRPDRGNRQAQLPFRQDGRPRSAPWVNPV
jgi:hypothetical protein